MKTRVTPPVLQLKNILQVVHDSDLQCFIKGHCVPSFPHSFEIAHVMKWKVDSSTHAMNVC